MTSDAQTIVDSGFIVALLDRRDSLHGWAEKTARQARGPWLTCEACIAEICHLLRRLAPAAHLDVYALIEQGSLRSQHLLPEQLASVRAEVARYRGRAVDFADACLMVLSDAAPQLPIVTVDGTDFAVYLRGRSHRHLLAPGGA